MTLPARRLAGIAGASVIAFAVAIWLLAGQYDGSEPPDLVSRGLASAVLLGAPGLIGLIGAVTRRRTVLVAAGVACLFQSAISFSGVALIIVLNVGFLGVVLLALVAGVASSMRRGGRRNGLTGGEAARGVAIVLLVIGAWAATLVLAETVCWIAHEAPGGAITWERIPPTNTLALEAGDVSGGCAGGTITPTGAAVAGGLLALAVGLAAFPDRRRRPVEGGGTMGPAMAAGG
jgi:hypothetical protein